MARYLNNSKIQRRYLCTTKLKKRYLNSNVIWSSGSLVSYYDGATLLGREEVDEGEDVLRPSITISKEGYTLVGWSTTNGGSKVTELVSTGEPMNLYAIFLPNSLVVASVTDAGVVTANADYVTGTLILQDGGTPYISGPASWNKTNSFSLDMGDYTHNTVIAKTRGLYNGSSDSSIPYISASTFDNVSVSRNSTRTFTNVEEGTHTLHIAGSTTQESTAVNSQTHMLLIVSITLSDPTQWV